MKDDVRDYVLFDLETTGLSPETEKIIEISALKVMNGKIVDEFSTLVNPGKHIPEIATSINGITDDMVKDAPEVKKALKDFLAFAGDMVLVGHNILSFDMQFINKAAGFYLGKLVTNDCVDTLRLSRRCLPSLPRHSLQALADYYGVSYRGAHRALADCRINYEVYERMVRGDKA